MSFKSQRTWGKPQTTGTPVEGTNSMGRMPWAPKALLVGVGPRSTTCQWEHLVSSHTIHKSGHWGMVTYTFV